MNLNYRSFLFMHYTRQEGIAHQLNAQAMTALALLIAETSSTRKDLIVHLIMNLLVKRGV